MCMSSLYSIFRPSGIAVNKTLISLLALCLWASLGATPALAQDRYISDVLFVPLRAGMGNEYRIVHRGLRSGSPLELIREAEADDGETWSLVRTADGEEGWVRNQFLVSEPTASIQLTSVERRAQNLAQEKRQLEQRVDQLSSENSRLQETLDTLRSEYQNLQTNYEELEAVSSGAVDLHEQHRELNEAYQLLQTRADVLQAENEMLKRERRYYDWLFGGAILFSGVILSFILQAIGKRRRKSEWG